TLNDGQTANDTNVSNHNHMQRCLFCNGNHRTSYCNANLLLDLRRATVIQKRLCFCCLGENYASRRCKTRVVCQICKRRHCTVVHGPTYVYYTGADSVSVLNSMTRHQQYASSTSETNRPLLHRPLRNRDPMCIITLLTNVQYCC